MTEKDLILEVQLISSCSYTVRPLVALLVLLHEIQVVSSNIPVSAGFLAVWLALEFIPYFPHLDYR